MKHLNRGASCKTLWFCEADIRHSDFRLGTFGAFLHNPTLNF
jgi:hypothetical protein